MTPWLFQSLIYSHPVEGNQSFTDLFGKEAEGVKLLLKPSDHVVVTGSLLLKRGTMKNKENTANGTKHTEATRMSLSLRVDTLNTKLK